ncbi:MAG: lysophospholipid acyltransferase family protein [Candidatus Competibacterales bacterium]
MADVKPAGFQLTPLELVLRTWRRLVKGLALGFHIPTALVIALVALRPRPRQGPPLGPVQWWFCVLCRLLSVQITTRGQPLPGPVLVVANHISWLDIAVINAIGPSYFVAKSAVRRWPVFGWLTHRAGGIFINRGEKNAAASATEQLVWRLVRGERLVTFPEATSTSGEGVKRFHPRLFQAAIHVQCPVQPLTVRYLTADGEVNSAVPFVGDDTLVGNLWCLMGERRIHAELIYHPPLDPADRGRTDLAREAERQVAAALRSPSLAALPPEERGP